MPVIGGTGGINLNMRSGCRIAIYDITLKGCTDLFVAYTDVICCFLLQLQRLIIQLSPQTFRIKSSIWLTGNTLVTYFLSVGQVPNPASGTCLFLIQKDLYFNISVCSHYIFKGILEYHIFCLLYSQQQKAHSKQTRYATIQFCLRRYTKVFKND